MSNNNLRLYEELRAVPKEAQKAFNNGRFSGTDINPMWRIKKLTETFGAAGLGWYTEVVYRHIQEAPDGTIATFIGINLYVRYGDEWSKPIYGEGGNTFASKTKSGYLSVTDEAFKMAYTDALSNATKSLGLGADVWFANDRQHSTKYDLQQERKAEVKPAAPSVSRSSDVLDMVRAAESVEELTAIWNANKSVIEKDEMLRGSFTRRKTEIQQANR